MIENEITEIHKVSGPGLLESAYEEMFCYELGKQGLSFKRQEIVPIFLKNL